MPTVILSATLLVACGDPGSDGSTLTTAATLEAGTDDQDSDDQEGCQSDAECAGNPNGPVCDEADGLCYPDCEPGDVDDCYEGAPGTMNVGACAEGTHTCQPGGTWGPCLGQTLPTDEICDDAIDQDCNGDLSGTDKDGDGWSTCDGDCCDDELVGCVDAHLANPGAFEVPDNQIDDDCDGTIDEVDPSCDTGLNTDSNVALYYARAMELCQTTTEDAPLAEKTWGLISSDLTLVDGEGTPLAVQRSIRETFGDNIVPSGGDSLVVLSSGHAAATGQTSPDFAAFESGQNLGTTVAAPEDWIAANGGEFPASCSDVNPTANTDANDSVMLSLRVRVPTNARSFTTRMFFFTAEYPEWVCSEFNDFFVALIDSSSPLNPADKNIAVYDDGQNLWPVGLNILKTASGLFGVCESGNVGCQGDLPQELYMCPDGPSLLAGTGFDAIDTTNSCNGDGFPVGGGTGWLEMSGNVEPGEIIDIRFGLWDAGGHLFDAVVLLDNWQWSLDAASPGVSTP